MQARHRIFLSHVCLKQRDRFEVRTLTVTPSFPENNFASRNRGCVKADNKLQQTSASVVHKNIYEGRRRCEEYTCLFVL